MAPNLMMATLNLHPPAITSQKVVDQSIDDELPLLSTLALDGSTLMDAFNVEAHILQMRGESIDCTFQPHRGPQLLFWRSGR
jgi:hypothetical protein